MAHLYTAVRPWARLGLLTLVAAAVGCTSGSGPVTDLPALDVRYAERRGPASTAPRIGPAGDAAHALGLPALHSTTLPDGARELRVSDWYGMIAGTPVPVLRLVEQPGRAAVGQWIWVWTERSEWPRRYRAARCSSWSNGVRVCAAGSTGTPPNWPAVAEQLDHLGAWVLTDRCETDGVHVTDSGALLIQRLAGTEFATYECNTPDRRSDSAAGRAALAVYRYFSALARQAGGPPPA